jgi:hypothetical protein
MSMLGTLTALVAFAAKPHSLPVVGLEAKLLHAARARIEELEPANVELMLDRDAVQLVNEKLRTERDAALERVLEIDNAYRRAQRRVAGLEGRLALYEGRRPHPMSHLCCVPSRSDALSNWNKRGGASTATVPADGSFLTR